MVLKKFIDAVLCSLGFRLCELCCASFLKQTHSPPIRSTLEPFARNKEHDGEEPESLLMRTSCSEYRIVHANLHPELPRRSYQPLGEPSCQRSEGSRQRRSRCQAKSNTEEHHPLTETTDHNQGQSFRRVWRVWKASLKLHHARFDEMSFGPSCEKHVSSSREANYVANIQWMTRSKSSSASLL